MKKIICLLLAFVMTVGILCSCEAAVDPLAGSQNIQSNQSTQSSGIAIPTTANLTTIPKSEIRLLSGMEVTYKGDVNLLCNYSVTKTRYDAEDAFTIIVQVKNVGRKIPYIGALEDQFGVAVLQADQESSYRIVSDDKPNTDDATVHEFAHLETVTFVYEFVVPQDALEGWYTLEASFFGVQVRFDSEAAKVSKYVPDLFDLPDDVQIMIVGEEMFNSHDYQSAVQSGRTLNTVFGEFDGVYVLFPPRGFGSTWVTYETVNGLTFKYGSSLSLRVYTDDGSFTLTDAFENGILSAGQLQEVYDNYYGV